LIDEIYAEADAELATTMHESVGVPTLVQIEEGEGKSVPCVPLGFRRDCKMNNLLLSFFLLLFSLLCSFAPRDNKGPAGQWKGKPREARQTLQGVLRGRSGPKGPETHCRWCGSGSEAEALPPPQGHGFGERDNWLGPIKRL